MWSASTACRPIRPRYDGARPSISSPQRKPGESNDRVFPSEWNLHECPPDHDSRHGETRDVRGNDDGKHRRSGLARDDELRGQLMAQVVVTLRAVRGGGDGFGGGGIPAWPDPQRFCLSSSSSRFAGRCRRGLTAVAGATARVEPSASCCDSRRPVCDWPPRAAQHGEHPHVARADGRRQWRRLRRDAPGNRRSYRRRPAHR